MRSQRGVAVLIVGLSLVVFGLVLPPLGTLIFGAVTDSPPATPPHFTAATLTRAWGEERIYGALLRSVMFATLTATLVLAIAGTLAWIVERTDARVRFAANLLVVAPIVMPAVLLVNAWIMLLSPRSGVINLVAKSWFGLAVAPFDIFSFPGMVWVGVLQEAPIAFLWLWPSFRSMNPELEEAGLASGARLSSVIGRITLPILRPTLLGAWIIFFIYSLGMLSVPLLIGQPAGIYLFSTEIYLAATQLPSDLNIASAYSLLFLIASFGGIALYRHLVRDTDRFATIRGRAFRPRRFSLGRGRIVVEAVVLLLLGAVAILPFLILLWNAFLPFPQAPSLAALHLVSLDNFKAALAYLPAQRALRNSLWIGFAAGIAATLIAVGVAWCTLRTRRMRGAVAAMDQVAAIPIAMPGLVVGMGMTWFYLEIPLPIYGTPIILLIAYVMLHLPYAIRICGNALGQLHPELEEAGRVSGAGEPTVLGRITLALLLPSLLASVVYVMLRSFREYAASVFLAGPGLEVVAVLVLDMSQSGNTNILAAFTVIITLVMSVAALLFMAIERRGGIRA